MNKIKVMSDDLANKIAAGEVVEKIANVVKELTENSLDAKSKNIKIELISSGTKLIKVIDDGVGMNKIDANQAFLRHATSKIYSHEDLFHINSLGFRGEALPSIASVSKVSLYSSLGNTGINITYHGGKKIEEKSSIARKGTIIEVKDLFYNTPARLKYLKSDATELANTSSLIEKTALANPDVSFSLMNNSNIIVKTTGSGNLLKTIHEIYGLDISKNMLEIKAENNDFEVQGFISKPNVSKPTRNYIITIVNGRVVKNFEINKIIIDAYHTYIPDNKFPVAVLNINTDPSLIDVNIHPTKQDIKVSKIKELEDLIFEGIKKTLYSTILIPKVEIKEIKSANDIQILKEDNIEIEDNFNIINEEQIDFNFSDNSINKEIKRLELYPSGLIFGTYIIAQNENAMYLIDQHAAAERINYERILKALEEEKLRTTDLLIPINIEFTPSDYLNFKENLFILTNLGFIVEDFGINTIIIKSHPIWLLEGYEEEQIKRIIDLILTIKNKFDPVKFNDKLAATAACKLSVKGNTNLTIEEMERILKDLVLCDNPYNCPHGRPTIITFTKYEIEKMFQRVVN
ncbi:MAG: DNA mismatch repair endonuclease MutL [Bacilli bacterium]|nr:DNA mismatch repair endonuclease MutL [Bacilli bacterium]